MKNGAETNFVFWGSDEFAVEILNELKTLGLKPGLIITAPDRPQGRKLRLTPPPAKLWAEVNNISYHQPENLKSGLAPSVKSNLNKIGLFLVASYGKILPAEILALPAHGTLNIHPSLLPKYRGATPIQSAILAGDKETGVSIIIMDEQIDHGAILGNKSYQLKAKSYIEARTELAQLGARLFAKILPAWLNRKITVQPQEHANATYTKKITKADGLIDLKSDGQLNYRKFLALNPWPGTYFFIQQVDQIIRVIITGAHLDSLGHFIIERVKPESKKEMAWADFERRFPNN